MAAAHVTTGVDELRALAGAHLGHSSWVAVTQEQVDRFRAATGDRSSGAPSGGDEEGGAATVPGHLTLSLVTTFMPQLLDSRGFRLGVNYGCGQVRFPAPVPVGSRLRCGATLDAVDDVAGGVQMTVTLVFEADGVAEPACVATILVRKYL